MSTNTELVVKELDSQVLSVIGNDAIQGFQKAFLVAEATGKLKNLLSAEYMAPIMNLQGNRLGFKTDKDRNGGYSSEEVKNCLIEAVLTGVQPVGNQFNIIAGNTYITKEGFGYLLSKMQGLWYQIIPDLPRVNQTNTSAAITMKISWSLNGGVRQDANIEIPIKVNSMMGTDAIIGKATRKARAWLYNSITGCEVSDGDVSELDSKSYQVSAIVISPDEEENQRTLNFLGNIETLKDFKEFKDSVPNEVVERLMFDFDNKENELILAETTDKEASNGKAK